MKNNKTITKNIKLSVAQIEYIKQHLENSYVSYTNKNKDERGIFDVIIEKLDDALDS